MKIIGITGGVGAGKTTVLSILREICNCEIVMADDVAKELMQYGKELSTHAIRLFGKESYNEDLTLNTVHIASLMYGNDTLKREWTDLVHPAVKQEILSRIDRAASEGITDCFFIEAALLLEEHYDEICNEIWYVYVDEQERIRRVMDNRGYTLDKARSIISNQMKHSEFSKHCEWIIDNGISVEDTRRQLENRLEEMGLV